MPYASCAVALIWKRKLRSMTREEAEKLDNAMRDDGSPYAHRLHNIDRINDDPNALSVRLIGHAPARDIKSKRGTEMAALSNFAEGVLGRPLRDEEMNVIVNPIPERADTRARI